MCFYVYLCFACRRGTRESAGSVSLTVSPGRLKETGRLVLINAASIAASNLKACRVWVRKVGRMIFDFEALTLRSGVRFPLKGRACAMASS